MTREEKIEKLRQELDNIYCINCRWCDEYDSDHCEDCHRKYMGWQPSEACLDWIIRTVEIPTVEADPVRHGKWIDEGYYADYTDASAWRCSECGWHMVGYADELFRYCPNCGAKLADEHGKPCDDCQEFDCYECKYAERKEE